VPLVVTDQSHTGQGVACRVVNVTHDVGGSEGAAGAGM
jgi:hypothetical protein